MTKKCSNCKNRCHDGWAGFKFCQLYEVTKPEEEEEVAKSCKNYRYGTPECLLEDEIPYEDYSPNCPWNAPGMSISDFI